MKPLKFTKQFDAAYNFVSGQTVQTRIKRIYSVLLLILGITAFQISAYSQLLPCKGGCTSNDVQIKRAFVKDAYGNDVTCIIGATPATGYLYLELTTNTPRIGVSVQANIVDANDLSEIYSVVGECFGVTLSSSTIVKFTHPITWTCGDPIALKDAFISWGTGNTNYCTGSAPQCPATPSKCWRQPMGEIITIDLTPCTPASITAHPVDRTICAGSGTTFNVTYNNGSGSTTVKWQRSTDGTAWTDINASLDVTNTTYTGFTSNTLTLVGSAGVLNGFKYKALVTSTSPSVGVPPCTVSSNIATLTVKAAPAQPTVSITAPSFCSATGSMEVTNPVAGYVYTFNYTGLSSPDIRTYIAGPLLYNNIPAGSNPTLSVSNGVCNAVNAPNGDICPTTIPPAVETSMKPNTVAASVPTRIVSENPELTVKAFPNPFNDRVRFVVNSTRQGNASLEILNTMGQKIKTINLGYVKIGENYFDLNLPSSQPGILVYSLIVNNKKVTGKIMQTNK